MTLIPIISPAPQEQVVQLMQSFQGKCYDKGSVLDGLWNLSMCVYARVWREGREREMELLFRGFRVWGSVLHS